MCIYDFFVDSIVDTNVFRAEYWKNRSAAVRKVLEFYLIDRDDVPTVDKNTKKKAILEFEKSCPAKIPTLLKKNIHIALSKIANPI